MDHESNDGNDHVSFAQKGWVSIWLGFLTPKPEEDFLATKFKAFDCDPKEWYQILTNDWGRVFALIEALPYANSFFQTAEEAASKFREVNAQWIYAQYEYDYDPAKAGLGKLPDDPYFLGSFR